MSRTEDLRALLARVEEAEKPSRILDEAVHQVLHLGESDIGTIAVPYTVSLDWMKWVVSCCLPGFWHSTTTCWRTADADIGPDFTGPHGDDLLAAGWSQEEHDGAVFQAVVAPGGPIYAECLALIAATLKALIAQEALKPPSPVVLAARRAALAAMKAAPTRAALIAKEAEHGR